MKYALTKMYVTGQERMVRNYGDGVWAWVCDTYRIGQPIIIQDVMIAPALSHLAERTRLNVGKVIIANVIAEYKDNPAECPVQRIANHWVLV